jgi:D-glycero-alpha-D-manno-heptose-7-phosphate kinase
LGYSLPNYEIAKIACKIEIDILKEPIGKQDQYGCAFGGLKLIQFNNDETVEIKPILLSNSKLVKLENNLLLYYTETKRKASSILSEQNKNTKISKNVKDNLIYMSSMAYELFDELNNGNIELIGDYLNEAWQRKKSLASKISNPEIDNIYKIALMNGATGGKLLGAGGGGFLLFYVPEEKHNQVRNALKAYRELPLKFDFEGTKIIYNK